MTSDILRVIDAATQELCACGCGTPLSPHGASAYFASAECQQRYHLRNTTNPHEVRGSHGVDPDQMRWHPDLVTAVDDTDLEPHPWLATTYTGGNYRASAFRYCSRPAWHLRLDDGHRFVGADLGEVAGDRDELAEQVVAVWERLEREMANTRHLAAGEGRRHAQPSPEWEYVASPVPGCRRHRRYDLQPDRWVLQVVDASGRCAEGYVHAEDWGDDAEREAFERLEVELAEQRYLRFDVTSWLASGFGPSDSDSLLLTPEQENLLIGLYTNTSQSPVGGYARGAVAHSDAHVFDAADVTWPGFMAANELDIARIFGVPRAFLNDVRTCVEPVVRKGPLPPRVHHSSPAKLSVDGAAYRRRARARRRRRR